MGQPRNKKQAQRDRATIIAKMIASTWLIAVRPDGQLTRANGHRLKSQEKQMLAVGGGHVITERVECEAENCVADRSSKSRVAVVLSFPKAMSMWQ